MSNLYNPRPTCFLKPNFYVHSEKENIPEKPDFMFSNHENGARYLIKKMS